MACPLCNSPRTTLFETDKRREYHRCSHCALIFVPPHQLLSKEEEHARYEKHNNSIDDAGYCRYLREKITDMQELGIDLTLGPIMDFGAGKEAVMTTLLRTENNNTFAYDPLYGYDDLSAAPFYLIIMNEVIEHLYTPDKVLLQLTGLLQPGGYLYINTELTNSVKEFCRWWYRSDPTHVHFYAEETMAYLGEKYSLELCANNHKNRVLFRKKEAGNIR